LADKNGKKMIEEKGGIKSETGKKILCTEHCISLIRILYSVKWKGAKGKEGW